MDLSGIHSRNRSSLRQVASVEGADQVSYKTGCSPEETAMAVKAIPDGYHSVTPYLMVRGAKQFIAFMGSVFGAKVTEQLLQPDGTPGHTELRLGDSLIMLSEAKADRPPTPVMLHIYVEDVDAAFERAVKAGGKVVAKPANQFYGDRSGGVVEPSGNTIWIATHIEDVPPAELQRRASAPRS
jgi:PhnB protein